MRNMVFISLSCSALMLGCNANANKLPVIHGVEAGFHTIKVQVTSNGCTSKESFKLHWQQNKLTLERIKPDNCRRMPHKKWLEFNLPEAVKSVYIANEFSF